MKFEFGGIHIQRKGAFDYVATLWYYTTPQYSLGRVVTPPKTTAYGATEKAMVLFSNLCYDLEDQLAARGRYAAAAMEPMTTDDLGGEVPF